MEHFDAEKVGIQVAKEAWHTDRSVEQKMHGALHQLSSEGIGRAIYLVRPEMEDGEQAELIGLAVPCGTLDASTDMEVSVAFVTGDVYTVKPGGKPGARAKFNATFMPSEHPETVHYPNAASAQHGLMYREETFRMIKRR